MKHRATQIAEQELKRLLLNEYSRGWQAGCKGKWPEHKPPTMPRTVMASVVTSLQALREACDSMQATLEEGDEFSIRLNKAIDIADVGLHRVTAWLRDTPEEDSTATPTAPTPPTKETTP